MIPESFAKLVGMWNGMNKLIMRPEDPIHESEAGACIGLEAKGKFLKLNYEWSFKGEKQEGLLLLNVNNETKAKSVWIDSFHQNSDFMIAEGNSTEEKISTKANYTQPEYSDWAWRICLETDVDDSFSLTMFNIFPDGKEVLAVDARFKRRA
jgi:hypothetical protein